MENQVEIWKSHPDIAGIEVSTLGRVRVLDRLGSRENRTYSKKGHVLKQRDTGKGYLQVGVKVDWKWVNKYVHRLVAETFLSNPDNLPQVNHKDNDRTNNNVNNLEWCTTSYNAKYREKFGISNTESQGHPVFAINLTTLEVSHFRSQSEASRELGVNNSNITAVIKGSRKTAGGYRFVNDDNNTDDTIKQKLYEIKYRATLNMH